jgi:hypothetical protein
MSKFIALGKAGSIGGTGFPHPRRPRSRGGCAGHHAQLRQFPLLSFLHGANHGHQNNVGEVAREPCERAEGPTRGVTRTTGARGTITTCAASAEWATMTERLKPVSAMAAGITAAITSFFVFIETPYIYHSQACSTALAAVGPVERDPTTFQRLLWRRKRYDPNYQASDNFRA